MRVLFLDDDPARHEAMKRLAIGHNVKHVHTAAEALEALQAERFDLAALDHDLGGQTFVPSEQEDTGYAVASAIADGRVIVPRAVVVHSFNPVGAQRMAERMSAAGVRVSVAPFGTWHLSN